MGRARPLARRRLSMQHPKVFRAPMRSRDLNVPTGMAADRALERRKWRYDADPGAWAVDLMHVRSCEWTSTRVPSDELPPSVHRSLARDGRNWQQIRAEDARADTARAWLHHRPGAA